MRFLWLLLCFVALPLAAETRVPATLSEVQLSFAPLVRQAAPAVVNIYARRVVAQRQNPFGADPFFSQIFPRFWTAQTTGSKFAGFGCDFVT